MRNPEDELPPIMVECPECKGEGWIKGLFFGWYRCYDCGGVGKVEQDATDARDDALEARRDARREE